MARYGSARMIFYTLESHGIELVEGTANTVTPVFTTTEHAQYDKTDKTGVINLAMQSVNAKGGTMYWFANPHMFEDYMVEVCYNDNVLAEIIAVSCEIKAPIEVALKSMNTGTVLTVTEADEVLWSAVFLVIIPVGALAAGFAVWFRRRRR